MPVSPFTPLPGAPGAFRRLRGLRFHLVSKEEGHFHTQDLPCTGSLDHDARTAWNQLGKSRTLGRGPPTRERAPPPSWEGLLAVWLERPRPQAGAASLSLAPGPRSRLGLEPPLDFRGLRSRPGSPACEGSVCGQLPGWCRKVQAAGAETRSPWLPRARCCLPGPLQRGAHLTGRQGL